MTGKILATTTTRPHLTKNNISIYY